jgi:hypothetical protein
MDQTEVNTEGWEQEKENLEHEIFMDPDGDSPF